ncbi:hypothetical protein JW964_18700 [candidate division KSB1 bacterium]|nr:hypothetical protein [candidate division KSB1 bacterium]
MHKKLWLLLISIFLLQLILSGCQNLPFSPNQRGKQKDNFLNKNLSLTQIENMVRKIYDSKATFTFEQYEQLLQEISKPDYRVLSLNVLRQTTDPTKILVGMRHDVDGHPFKALKMAQMEQSYQISSTYFILHSAEYYGNYSLKGVTRYPAMDEIYQKINLLGHEIGIHNDLLALMVFTNIDPLEFTHQEIACYQRLGIPIYGTSSHGGKFVLSHHLKNLWIFSDFHEPATFSYLYQNYNYGLLSLKEMGFEYEAYNISYNKYLSDSGGGWNEKKVDDPIKFLQECKPGDRVVILTHPLWWGK